MILLGLLIVPLVAGPLAFFLRRRPMMEVRQSRGLRHSARPWRPCWRPRCFAAVRFHSGMDSFTPTLLVRWSFSCRLLWPWSAPSMRSAISVTTSKAEFYSRPRKLGGRFAVDKLREYYALMPLSGFRHDAGRSRQQPGNALGGDRGHHPGVGVSSYVLRPRNLARGGLEIRHHRRRRPFHGVVRHDSDLLFGP